MSTKSVWKSVCFIVVVLASVVHAELIAEYDASKVIDQRPDQVTPAWTARGSGSDPAFVSDQGDYLLQHWYEPANPLHEGNYGSWMSPDVPGFSMTKGAGQYGIEFKIKPIGDLRSSGANYAAPNLMLSWVDDVDWYLISIDRDSDDGGPGTLGRITRGRFTMITLIDNIDWSVPHVIGIAYHGDLDQLDFFLDGVYQVSTSTDDVRNDAAPSGYDDIFFGDCTTGDYDADAQWYYVRLYSAASDIGEFEPQCGYPGTVYRTTDLNKDCEVNTEDLAWMANEWPACSDISAGCIEELTPMAITEQSIFVGGEAGYPRMRIPALLTTSSGTLLAFCEARYGGDGDHTDMVLKRSFDNGQTWTDLQVIIAGDYYGSDHAMMEPCPMLDEDTDTIWLLFNYVNHDNSAENKLLVLNSVNDGARWRTLTDLTPSVGMFYPGPGIGVQLAGGRLLVPGFCGDSGKSKAIYSDDHGLTWQAGNFVEPSENNNECQAVELVDGDVMINMRSWFGTYHRAVATSTDGGINWSDYYYDPMLIEPSHGYGCQASILRYTRKSDGYTKNRILFSNPASSSRANMTVRLSYDEAQTWPISKVIYSGPVAYSCLAILSDGTIGLLYEKAPLETNIVFARFGLDWLTDGADQQRYASDFDGNDHVNLNDWARLAADWLKCTDPARPEQCDLVLP